MRLFCTGMTCPAGDGSIRYRRFESLVRLLQQSVRHCSEDAIDEISQSEYRVIEGRDAEWHTYHRSIMQERGCGHTPIWRRVGRWVVRLAMEALHRARTA
jgi:hypothetical protein